jgi:hypothetical protein
MAEAALQVWTQVPLDNNEIAMPVGSLEYTGARHRAQIKTRMDQNFPLLFHIQNQD